MLTIQTLLQLVAIPLALAGAYMVAYTVYNMRGKIDGDLLRAKVFLNESFIKDNWLLLLLASFFFLINATIKLNGMFGLIVEDNNSELVQEVTIFGVLACSVLSQYKWLQLISPPKKSNR